MKEVLQALAQWKKDGEAIALATLVRVRRSAPRLPGARLCVTHGGQMVGSVSGGCVESDVLERARRALDDGRSVIATYGISDEMGFRVGLSCGGSIDVLIEPIASLEPWRTLERALTDRRPAGLATALEPSDLLGHHLLYVDGAVTGSIDPDLDADVSDAIRLDLGRGAADVVTLAWRGQEAAVFVETFPPPPRLFIIGGTHTAMPLSRMAKSLGFHVAVIDPRSALANRERFPEADEIHHAWPGEMLEHAGLDAYSYVVVLAHDPKFDLPALSCALRSKAAYVGAIGSRATREKRRERLQTEEGFTVADCDRVRSPIGLDIGARTPEEMALAVLAEMIAVRSRRDGRPLRERKGPIHGDG